ncbi:MAG: DUF4244 domain-containing protein, partial [Actinomycetota bacterium]
MKDKTIGFFSRIQQSVHRFASGDDDGQATTEYALILLAAAVIAVLV